LLSSSASSPSSRGAVEERALFLPQPYSSESIPGEVARRRRNSEQAEGEEFFFIKISLWCGGSPQRRTNACFTDSDWVGGRIPGSPAPARIRARPAPDPRDSGGGAGDESPEDMVAATR
uniref:Uncharacterized protein n=1 Tax=Oryza brachyantha TaxID=4533 RepID=J3KV80_ORYBR